ncbi:MAG: hypothetical protein HRU33_21020 [Rhodobacteraceae bacterium]|nr:hypothetical protein [Paracoccaceae bacterium]
MKKIEMAGWALVLFLLPDAAQAAFIGVAIKAVALFAGTGTIGAFVVRIGISMALSALAVALKGKPKASAATGIKTETSTGGTNPQSFILGRYATGGNLVAPGCRADHLRDHWQVERPGH